MPGHLTGTGTLVRAHLRAGWRGLAAWTVLMVALVAAVAASVAALYPTAADRRAYAESAGGSPAVAAFNGRGHDLTELGAIVGFELGFMALVAFPVVAVHLAIRFTRHEEDAGRTELATAGRVGRLAPLAAGAGMLLLCVAVFVPATALALVLVGLPAGGAWLYAAALGTFIGGHGAVGLLAAEVSREARTAYTLGLVFVLVTFLVRAVVDGRGLDATWASPSGWLAEVRPWGESRWWPLAAYAALAGAAGLLALAVAARRDLGGGLLATRSGPARGSHALGTPVGLAWRFTRPPLVGWLAGTVVWSAAFGALAGEMTDIVEANPSMLEVLGVERAEHVVTSLALLLCGLGASAFGVQSMSRLAKEESAGRLGLLLSTRAARWRVWSAWLGVVLAGAALTLMTSALALGLSTAWSTDDRGNVPSALGGGLALLVPVVLVVAVAAALQAADARLAAVAWVPVGWSLVVGMLAEVLRLPEWSRDLSPLHVVGRIPMEGPHPLPTVVMLLLSAVLVAAGLSRFRTRELAAG